MEQAVHATWGHSLWIILHHCTERIGTIPSKGASSEEKILWLRFLQQLQYTLPCVKCRTHYSEHYHRTGPPVMGKESIRRWLYDLHASVNRRLEKQNIPYEVLEEIYSRPFSFKDAYTVIEKQAHIALRVKWYSRNVMEKFLNDLKCLRRFYQL